MTTKPNRTAPEDDLAFMRSIVQGDGRPPVTLAICYLAGGLLYGVQCLFHIGQILGVIRWPEFANLAFLIGITGTFLAILIWAVLEDRRTGFAQHGPLAARTMNAAFSCAGMANTAVLIIFGVGAVRDQDFGTWLYYASIIFTLQAAAWMMAWTLRKKLWMLLTALGGWVAAVALGLLVREPVLYLYVCTAALFLLFAGPGVILFRAARAPREA